MQHPRGGCNHFFPKAPGRSPDPLRRLCTYHTIPGWKTQHPPQTTSSEVYPPRCGCPGLAPSPAEQANSGRAVTANRNRRAKTLLPLLLHHSALRHAPWSLSVCFSPPRALVPSPVQTWQLSSAGCRAPALVGKEKGEGGSPGEHLGWCLWGVCGQRLAPGSCRDSSPAVTIPAVPGISAKGKRRTGKHPGSPGWGRAGARGVGAGSRPPAAGCRHRPGQGRGAGRCWGAPAGGTQPWWVLLRGAGEAAQGEAFPGLHLQPSTNSLLRGASADPYPSPKKSCFPLGKSQGEVYYYTLGSYKVNLLAV